LGDPAGLSGYGFRVRASDGQVLGGRFRHQVQLRDEEIAF
jgi:hypothetical protein